MNPILSTAIQIALLFAIPLLASALYRALNKLADKLHIQFTQAQEDQLRALAGDAASAAEEFAAQKIKAGQTKPSGDDKMEFAVTHLTTVLPGLTPKSAITLIKAALPRLGLGATYSVIPLIAVLIMLFGVTAPAIAQPSLLGTLQQERAKYGTPMQPAQLGEMLNAVALRGGPDWRLLSKPSGNHCPSPVGFISCDYLVYAPTGQGFDVLQDEEGAAIAVWNKGDVFTADRLLKPSGTPTAPPPSDPPPPVADNTAARLTASEAAIRTLQGIVSDLSAAIAATTEPIRQQQQLDDALLNNLVERVGNLERRVLPTTCIASFFGFGVHCELR